MYITELLNTYGRSIHLSKDITFISPQNNLYFEIESENIDIDIYCGNLLKFSYNNNKISETYGILKNISDKNINIKINKGSCNLKGIFTENCDYYHIPFDKCKVKQANIDDKNIIVFIYDSNMIEYVEVFLESISDKKDKYSLVMLCKEYDYIPDHIKPKVNVIYFNSELTKYKKWHKTIIYAIASITNAESFLFFDVDMYINSSLSSLMNRIEVLNDEKILICKEQGEHGQLSLKEILSKQKMPYFESKYSNELINIIQDDSILINGGIIAGKRKAFLRLESKLRSFEHLGIDYLDENKDADWREQALLNIGLCLNNSIIELDKSYNKQLFNEQNKFSSMKELKEHHNQEKILHFNGNIGREIFHKVKNTIGK